MSPMRSDSVGAASLLFVEQVLVAGVSVFARSHAARSVKPTLNSR